MGTTNKCRCLKTWQEEGVGGTCKDYCCNPDGDTNGEWSFVEDWDCEESDWGYCTPASPDTSKEITETEATCLDIEGWSDIGGDDCETYAANNWCTLAKQAGYGWHEEWGSIGGFKSDEVSAFQACCKCGGGTVPIKEVPSQTSKFLVISIATSLLLTCVFGITSCYWRSNYQKIRYANLGAETIGRTVVNEKPEDI